MRQNPAVVRQDARKAPDPAEHPAFRPSKKPPDPVTPVFHHKTGHSSDGWAAGSG
jgi:hypothetical protein